MTRCVCWTICWWPTIRPRCLIRLPLLQRIEGLRSILPCLEKCMRVGCNLQSHVRQQLTVFLRIEITDAIRYIYDIGGTGLVVEAPHVVDLSGRLAPARNALRRAAGQ